MSTTTTVKLHDDNSEPKPLLREGKQMIGIANIEWLEKLQPRESVDNKWSQELSVFMKEGSKFPSIRIYQMDDGRLIAAEGWHRRDASIAIGNSDIFCEVKNGTLEDAIVYAAGSNRGSGPRPMGPKDITKALKMLFATESWLKRPTQEIADYVGCGTSKVRFSRVKFCKDNGIQVPEFILTSKGMHSLTAYRGDDATRKKIVKTTYGYTAKYKGKRVNGKTKEIVLEKLKDLMLLNSEKKRLLSGESVSAFLYNLGFVGCGFSVSIYPGISGYYQPGMICIPCNFSNRNTLLKAVGTIDTAIDIQNAEKLLVTRGQLVAAEYKKEFGCRKVILCYKEDGPFHLIELFKAAGFEFMNPDELTDSLKGAE